MFVTTWQAILCSMEMMDSLRSEEKTQGRVFYCLKPPPPFRRLVITGPFLCSS